MNSLDGFSGFHGLFRFNAKRFAKRNDKDPENMHPWIDPSLDRNNGNNNNLEIPIPRCNDRKCRYSILSHSCAYREYLHIDDHNAIKVFWRPPTRDRIHSLMYPSTTLNPIDESSWQRYCLLSDGREKDHRTWHGRKRKKGNHAPPHFFLPISYWFPIADSGQVVMKS